MSQQIRVRFAPSPTGGLHIGGVRTALYNYLFAKKHQGTFILRIEDTDQTRFVAGAEEYILQCLEWCGISPDESVLKPGAYGPYRQSERKELYKQYAEQLVAQGHAYYAFDTPEEIAEMRTAMRPNEQEAAQYGTLTRDRMKNSLSLSAEEVQKKINSGEPYVIRIKMPADETVIFEDAIRGKMEMPTNTLDDKVLLKADGMPTYHLAVVVDDYLMKITHAFRGEEWLPSAPAHVLLWRYLGWGDSMPVWAHLPLILKPDGHGKLSKRDGERLGFPVFAMNWTDPKSGETAEGFKEKGFLPEALINLLAMLGWSPGSEQEIFSLEEMVQQFSLERVQKSAAKFNYDKAKWFNQQYILQTSNTELVPLVMPFLKVDVTHYENEKLEEIVGLIKERCALLSDFWTEGKFFFERPITHDLEAIRGKWNDEVSAFFNQLKSIWLTTNSSDEQTLEASFLEVLKQQGVKKGDVMLPLRIMLVGAKHGPGVFKIAHIIGLEESIARIDVVLLSMQQK